MSVVSYIKIARFDHWVKQLFVIPGIVFAFFMHQSALQHYSSFLLPVLIGLLATGLIASANYVINEWLDAEFDQFHPVKKFRPVVTKNLKVSIIIFEYIFLLFVGLGLAYLFLPETVFVMEIILAVMGIIYNVRPFRSKDYPYIDVLSESLNNSIRLLIGWFLISPDVFPPISIVLGYWMGGAFLMATKRFAEYRMINNPSTAALYRKSFQFYTEESLLLSSFFYALLSVFFVGIFLVKYRMELLFAIPVLCGLFCLYLKLAYHPDSVVQKPEKLFHEKKLMLYCVFFVVLVCVLLFIEIPGVKLFYDTTLLDIR